MNCFLSAAITTHIAHIELRSPNFASLHWLYEKIYKSCEDWYDRFAERVVAKGGNLPTFRYQQSPPLSADRIKDVLTALVECKRELETNRGTPDSVMVALIDTATEDIDKYIWQLSASL